MLGIIAAAAVVSATPTPPTAGLADFEQLKAELQRSYSNLAWMGSRESGIDLPALDRRTRQALAAAETDDDVLRALRTFVTGLHDGHFSELPFIETTPAASSPEPAPALLDAADPVGGCAALGFAPAPAVAFSLPFESLPGVRLLSDGLSQPFRLAIATLSDGRKVGLVRIPVFRARSSPASCVAAWARLRAAGTAATPEALRISARDAWFASLAGDLARLRMEGAASVLVDVGNNGGGDDSGDWAVRVFTSRPVASSRLLVASAPPGRAYIDEELTNLREAQGSSADPELGRAIQTFETARTSLQMDGCDLSWVWRERRSWNAVGCTRLTAVGYASGPLRSPPASAHSHAASAALYWPSKAALPAAPWTGPVFVLTDGKTYSSAEMFAAEMQDNRVARLIGARTGGDGCGFMSAIRPVTLSRTRLRFRIPNCVRLRADGSDEVKGVTPDLPLSPAEGLSERARAARALELAAPPRTRGIAIERQELPLA